MSPVNHLRVLSRHATVWMTLTGLCFTVALFAVARNAAVSREDLCHSINQQGRVLIRAMDGNLAALEKRYQDGEVTRASYEFSRRILLENRRLAVDSRCEPDANRPTANDP